MKKICAVVVMASAMVFAQAASAEVQRNVRKVGFYSCGTMYCSFLAQDQVSYGFEPSDAPIADKIFAGCQHGNICSIVGDFDAADERIEKVIKVEDSGMEAEQY